MTYILEASSASEGCGEYVLHRIDTFARMLHSWALAGTLFAAGDEAQNAAFLSIPVRWGAERG